MTTVASPVDVISEKTLTHRFRDFDATAKASIANVYERNHTTQTLDFVLAKKKLFGSLTHAKMTMWEVVERLDSFVDESDPDISLGQSHHAYQTAEVLRKKYPADDWIHLIGFIHDLGKVLYVWGEDQSCVVGDTFPVGCPFSEKIVHHEFFKRNADYDKYTSKFGMYKEECGFDSLHFSWGHDEYLATVLEKNGSTLPPEAIYLVRYHSFYPWHREGAYEHLASEKDKKMLPLLKSFSNCDLYSKEDKPASAAELRSYYDGLLKKYKLDGVLCW
eukprot:TRINITY_DN1538_c0_g1_i1.p1 TRINITY_DN1538_c0_g1~~TRINITY_DN1538_c0_g1_i1.p1  ORF type:complete len:275 (-),score=62.13 TRINITY_DN1538_c0_g1_i1:105-929(-)